MSVTKSVTSTCIGIAVDLGFIKSVSQSIFDFLPEYQHFKKDGKDKITIKHLLTMTSGLDWNEWALPYSNMKNDVIQMVISDDPVEYYLNKPLIDEPGTSFKYSGGCNILLGKILENATKMNIDDFAGKYLFGPLGIDLYYWSKYESGAIDAAGGLRITPRDMVKIGAMFLNKGIWHGKRIISEQWVGKSTESFPGNSWMNNWDDYWGMRGYGYMWWTHTFTRESQRIGMFYAAGWGGQFIMVIPVLNTVVVFTEGNYLSYRPAFEILKKYIIPAIG
jgi:CubicO group peptidase (beta-lactamase class C family)